jgi:hypothetical protein
MKEIQLTFAFISPDENTLRGNPAYDWWFCQCSDSCTRKTFLTWEYNYHQIKTKYKNPDHLVWIVSAYCESKIPANWKLAEQGPTYKVYLEGII